MTSNILIGNMSFKIIKFENENCVPCKNVGNLLDSARVEYETVQPFKDPDTAIKFRIRTVPVTVLLKDDVEVARSVGFNPVELNEIINKFNGVVEV